MIKITEDNDPYLFSIHTAHGELVIDYMLMATEMTSIAKELKACETAGDSEAQFIPLIGGVVRRTARSADVAAACTDGELVAAWSRVTSHMDKMGKG